MSSASSMWEVGSVVLGWVRTVASWRRPTGSNVNNYPPMVIVQSSAENDDGVHVPAASVTIASREGLIALRSAIDEALKEGGPQ